MNSMIHDVYTHGDPCGHLLNPCCSPMLLFLACFDPSDICHFSTEKNQVKYQNIKNGKSSIVLTQANNEIHTCRGNPPSKSDETCLQPFPLKVFLSNSNCFIHEQWPLARATVFVKIEHVLSVPKHCALKALELTFAFWGFSHVAAKPSSWVIGKSIFCKLNKYILKFWQI